MRLLVCKIFLFISVLGFSQSKFNGKVIDALTKTPIAGVSIYNANENKLFKSNQDGLFELDIKSNNTEVLFYLEGYNLRSIFFSGGKNYEVIELSSKIESLDEVVVRANKKKVFQIERLKDFEETYVYAGKKNEVILMSLSMANLASNNARQVYSQIPGINIFQNDDAGLQLNIGGRGLNPNRSSNFNTRQNNYDISADALGYPESYYTPANEGLEEIQILRGAASLQYGTQFGGLVNFVMKKPNPEKKFEIITRNTLGSNGLYTNFSDSNKLNNIIHVDFWEEISVQPGWNHLLDEWVDQGYYKAEDIEKDKDSITSLRILGEKDGKKIYLNVVDTHGPGVKSSLYIIEAIWNSSWSKVVQNSSGTGCFILPQKNEYFGSLEELINWSEK